MAANGSSTPDVGCKVLRVFLSHTSDLRNFPSDRSYIAAAETAVIRVGHAVADMAYFAARDAAPAAVCESTLAQADVYIGVIGDRYGSPVRNQPSLSYTELEFEAATRLRMPRLLFLVETHMHSCSQSDESTDLRERQAAFRRRLLENSGLTMVKVTSPSELELQVHHALTDLLLTRASEHSLARGFQRVGPLVAALLVVALTVLAVLVSPQSGSSWFSTLLGGRSNGQPSIGQSPQTLVPPAASPRAPESIANHGVPTVVCSLAPSQFIRGDTITLTYVVYAPQAMNIGLGAGLYDEQGVDHTTGLGDTANRHVPAGRTTISRPFYIPNNYPSGQFELVAEVWPPNKVGADGANTIADARCSRGTLP